MKKITIPFLTLMLAIIAFSATDAFAQKRIILDSSGNATARATVQGTEGDSAESWTISGKQFSSLQIKQTNSGKFKYEIKRGSQFLSSGHTTGSNIQVKSDGTSTYTFTIINEENRPRLIVLSLSGTPPRK